MTISDMQNIVAQMQQTLATQANQVGNNNQPLMSSRSAISAIGRFKYGFADDFGKLKILKDEGYSGKIGSNVGDAVRLPNGEYGVRINANGVNVIRPVDPKGWQVSDAIGDVAESAGKAITTGGAIAGGLLAAPESLGTMSVGGAGLGGSLGEGVRQSIGALMGVRSPESFIGNGLTYSGPSGQHISGLAEIAGEGALNALSTKIGNKLFPAKGVQAEASNNLQKIIAKDPISGLDLTTVRGPSA
jgi:hypothetical protein